MCGIAGILNQNGRRPDEHALRAMTRAMAHRGPDDEGYLWRGPVGLGHRRLSILDIAGGHQPMSNEDGSVWVVFNGEIYNYIALRDQLTTLGHQFRTRSDTETILHLYEEHGEHCVRQLRGMFAFAVWDDARQQLFLARDRMGEKPLYYVEHQGVFSFASEINALRHAPRVDSELDPVAFDQFLDQRFVPGPRTIYRSIRKLLPGHTILRRAGCEARVSRFWEPPVPQPDAPPLQARELEGLLAESVRAQLVADVPVGAFLSGGLDSSLIVALAARTHRQPIKTFSIGFDAPGAFDESAHALAVATALGTDHQAFRFGAVDFARHIESAVESSDEPMADAATVPTFLLSRAAARDVKVVLTGDGGDELFAGYRRHRREQLISRWASPWWRGCQGFPLSPRARKALRLISQAPDERRYEYHRVFSRAQRESLFPWLKEVRDSEPVTIRPIADFPSPVDWLLWVEAQTWLPDDFLFKTDRMTMAASLEARAPLLDVSLVETMMRQPACRKVNRHGNKLPLREVARRHLPPEIVERPKHGFDIPLDHWLRTDLKSVAADLLLSRAADPWSPESDAVRVFWEQHQHGQANHGLKLWTLMCWNLWRQKRGC